VFGGVLPLEKIGDTSDLSLVNYSGIYITAGATRFTVFAVHILLKVVWLMKGRIRNCDNGLHPSHRILQIPPPRMARMDDLYRLVRVTC